MPPKNNLSTSVQFAFPKLLTHQLALYSGAKTTNISSMPLSMLVIESAKRYLAGPAAFGKSPKTIDEALKPAFAKMFSTNQYRQIAKTGFDLYDQYASQVTALVGGKKLISYCSTVPSVTQFKLVLEELSSAKVLHLPDEIALAKDDGANLLTAIERCVTVVLDGIECKNPEEQQTPKGRQVCYDVPYGGQVCVYVKNPLFEAIGSGDEIYYTTFAALHSKDGFLVRTSKVSAVTEHVGTAAGHLTQVPIPDDLKYIVNYDLHKHTLLPHALPAYHVVYAISLFERDYSEEERRQAMAQAALDATNTVADLAQMNLVGAGIDLAQFLYHLAIALDDDDVLGSVHFGFNNIGQMPLGLKDTTVTFKDTHWLNEYEYVVKSHFELQALA